MTEFSDCHSKPAHRSLGRIAAGLTLATMLSATVPGAANAESIKFWTQPQGDLLAFQQLFDSLASDFKAKSGIDVNVEVINWSVATNTWLTVAQGGAAPDCAGMFWLHSFSGIGGGKYGPMPITEYRSEWPNLDKDFYPGTLVDVNYKGEFYGIPWRVDIRPMIYRTDFFKEAGITAPPKTWDEIIEIGKKLTVRDKNGNVTRWGFYPGNTQPGQTLMPYYWQAGGEMMNEDGTKATIDNEAMRTALKFLHDLVHVYKITSPEIFEKSADPQADFAAGTLAMAGSVGSNWGTQFDRDYPDLDGKWAMALNPKGPKNADSYSGAGYWGLLRGTQHAKACIDWIKFLSSPENMQRISEVTGVTSPMREVMASPFWSDRPWKKVIAEELNYAHTSQQPSAVWSAIASPEPGAVLYDLVYSTVIGDADIDAVVKKAQVRMQAELDRAKAK
jgi:multiple sugar transport system substrate-binding protein